MAVLFVAAIVGTGAARAETKCRMTFDLRSWSAFYKSSKGEGTITCDTGESARVSLRAKGGGLTVGKSKIVDGEGVFSPVEDIRELYGAYAQGEAHAGAGSAVAAQGLTKGEVSLSLTGKGHGVDLGVSFGKFTIEPVGGKG